MTAPHLGPGHTIAGKYRISALLGFTGEVATYRVAAPQGGELVVKLYDPSIGQRADVMSRLERVHATLASLPDGAVRVVDSGYDLGTGSPFAATELVTVPSLAEICGRGPMAPADVAAMLHGLAQIIDAAHARQLHHHALKPTNLFVAPGLVRVSDFDASVVRSTSPTHEAYVRSAPWWAPEQLHPSAVLGPATDVFAAALLAFFALTGRSYWRSCQTSPPDLSGWQAEVMAPRVLASQRARELGGAINPALDVVFERALAISQSERPSSIGEMANAFASLAGYRADNGAKTLAFPEMSVADVGGYAAVGASAHSPATGSPAMGAPQPMGAQPIGESPAAVPPGAAQPAHGDYGRGPAAGPGGAETAVAPGLPPIPLEPKKQKSPLLPIALGVIVALLLGAAGISFLFLRGDDTTAAEADRPSPKEAAESADAAGDDSNDSAAETERASDDGAGGAATDAPAEPSPVKVTVRCAPVACDEVWVDGQKLDDTPTEVELAPGTHELKVTAKGHYPRTEKLVVEAESPLEKEYRLAPIKAQPPKPKPCGQFLKPCP